MARKPASKKTSSPAPAASTAPVSTPVRNSPVPKIVAPQAPAPKKEITHDMIAKRAYEIHLSGTGGDETSNWLRAERELRGK